MKKIAIIFVVLIGLGIAAWVLLGGKGGIGEVFTGEEADLSLSEVLAKAEGMSSFSYDMIVTSPGQAAMTTKMWWKEKKIRTEGTYEGKDMVYLLDIDQQLAYMYFPSENTAMKMSFGTAQENVGESPAEQSASLMDYNPLTLGTETLDGKKCLVIEYTNPAGKTKSWLWQKYGFPIKTETTTSKGTSVMELKNIDFGNIADSMFELPAGVQIMQIPSLGF